jgi:hypothetical protein
VFCVRWSYFVRAFNGSDSLAVTGRDKRATRRPLGTQAVEGNTAAQIKLSDFYTQQGARLPGDRLLGYRGYRTGIRSAPNIGGAVLVGGITSDTEPSADAPAASPVPPSKALDAGKGYQADRVARALDLLEDAGVNLNDYTRLELKRLVLERIPSRAGFNAPSRNTLDRVIRRRLAK